MSKLSQCFALSLSLFALASGGVAPNVYAGSAGIFGGLEDASQIVGDTFNPAEAVVILESTVPSGMKVDAATQQLVWLNPDAIATAAATLNGQLASTPVGGLLAASQAAASAPQYLDTITTCIRETIRSAGGSEEAGQIGEELAIELALQPNRCGCRNSSSRGDNAEKPPAMLTEDMKETRLQCELCARMLLTVQGLTADEENVDPLQVNNAINTYNAFIYSLDQTQLQAFKESSSGQNLTSALKQIRAAIPLNSTDKQ